MKLHRLKKFLFLLNGFLLSVGCLFAQINLPHIRATSKNVKIRDGAFVKDWWYITPEVKPDVYWVDYPYKEQIVTFITDIDSISFSVKQGSQYDFVIVLNGKDSAFTQIAGSHQHRLSYSGSNGSDSIPFTFRDNRIYLDGTINGSETLKIQFDLGAGMSNINAKSTARVNMDFDSSTFLINSQGRNKARVSNNNEITLGKLSISPDAFVETKNMARWEDAIIGNSLFLNKYLEIDYNKKLFIVHDSMPPIDSGWKKMIMQLDGGVRPMIQATLEIAGLKYTDWYLFDTGNSGNGMLSNELTGRYGIYDQFSKIVGFGGRRIANMPKLSISGHDFDKGTIVLEKPGAALLEKSLIGNEILSKFNVIIDNCFGYLYLKPNQLLK